MIEKEVQIINKLGLHARAAAKLVSTAAAYGSSVKIEFAGQTADAKSIMSVMMLAAAQGSEIKIRCEGDDEAAALDALLNLINDYFGEDD